MDVATPAGASPAPDPRFPHIQDRGPRAADDEPADRDPLRGRARVERALVTDRESSSPIRITAPVLPGSRACRRTRPRPGRSSSSGATGQARVAQDLVSVSGRRMRGGRDRSIELSPVEYLPTPEIRRPRRDRVHRRVRRTDLVSGDEIKAARTPFFARVYERSEGIEASIRTTPTVRDV